MAFFAVDILVSVLLFKSERNDYKLIHILYALKNKLLYWVWDRDLDKNTYKVHEILIIFKYGSAAWRGNGKLRNSKQNKSVLLYMRVVWKKIQP